MGDFVLTGGEIAAMAVADAVCRMVPGVLPDPECYEDESHFNGLLEYPQYSRPEVWQGMRVPEALLTGESDAVERTAGDKLLSGSFVASGHCVARVEHVGAENYAAQIAAGGKRWKRPDSEILNTIDRIIRVMAAVILPVGAALFVKQWFFVHATPQGGGGADGGGAGGDDP